MLALPLTVEAVGFEEHTWLAESDGMTSRSRLAASSGAYRSATLPAIAERQFPIPMDLAADVEEAASALAAFDTYARATLGPQSNALGPMSAVLLRTESASSSQIENLTVGARQLALAEVGQSTSPNANAVVANVHAMEAALELADRLDESAILGMHRVLLEDQPGWHDHAGHYRDQLVWIGRSSISPLGASYVAPQHGLVPAAMADLVGFLRRNDLPVVAQAAIAHAQFETIHPFTDGNGRTGRALVHALLKGKELLRSTTAPVSAGLLRRTEAYFTALSTYRAGDARPIVEQFCDAARFAASSGSRLIDSLAGRIREAGIKLDDARVRSDATARRVLPHLVSHPVVTSALLKEQLALPDPTAHRALATLSAAGVVEERTGKRRGRVWQHSGILADLDAYAESVRRG